MRFSVMLKMVVLVASLPAMWWVVWQVFTPDGKWSAVRPVAEVAFQVLMPIPIWLLIFRVVEAVTVIPVFTPFWRCVCFVVGLVVDIYVDTPRRVTRALCERYAWQNVETAYGLYSMKLEADGSVVFNDETSLANCDAVFADEAAVYTLSGRRVHISPSHGEALVAQYRPDGWYVRRA